MAHRLTIDPHDTSWLPPHMPDDIWSWAMQLRPSGHGLVRIRGTHAYEFIGYSAGGCAVEIKAYLDGHCTHHWRREPMEGIWPGTYEWQAVAIYGQGLVR